jgi:UDP-glucuronate 4-epimerase
MTNLSGKRVLITGASGLVAFPIAVELAKANETYAVARFSDPEQKRMLEAAGVRTIPFDMANPDLSALPKADVVTNCGVLPPTHKDA